jgi:predicted transcriptional regulator
MKNKKYLVHVLIFILMPFLSIGKNMASDKTYGVYVDYSPGNISEFNARHSLLKNEKNEVITGFGGRNGAGGASLGEGVQNSSSGITEIPSKMEVLWFSIAEDQFWHGEFELPKKELSNLIKKEKVLDLFSMREGNKIDKYRQIVVNVAPKGKVYVYAGGQAAKLVGIYQAKAVDYDYDKHALETYIGPGVNESRKEYIKSYTKSLFEEQLYAKYNEDYFKPVRWQLAMKGTQPILAYVTKTLNGEYTHVLEKPTEQEIQSIPTNIAVDFLLPNGKPKRLDIWLNKAFEFFNQHFDYQSKFKIIVETPDEDHTAVYFQQGDKIVEFEDIEVEELE